MGAVKSSEEPKQVTVKCVKKKGSNFTVFLTHFCVPPVIAGSPWKPRLHAREQIDQSMRDERAVDRHCIATCNQHRDTNS